MASGLPPLILELRAQAGEALASMKEVGDEAENLGTKTAVAGEEAESRSSAAFNKLAGVGKAALLGLVAGAAVVGVEAVKMAGEMGSADATIAGNAQIPAKAAKSIGDAFLHTAFQSTFSGLQMAQAFGPVAGVVQKLAGHTLTTADSMKVMSAASDLAEASGGNLSSTTSTLVTVMQAYGLKLGDAASTSNLLYNTSRLTGVGLSDIAGGVDKLHMKLGVAAPDLTDTSALMEDLASHGVAGSRGLMAVSTGFTTLLGGSKATNTELSTLGVHVFDANGKFVGMANVLSQLSPKLATMTDEQRAAAEKALFGASAGATLNQTLLAGVTAFNSSTQAVTKSNAVKTAAAAASNSLHGQEERLRAGVDDLVTMFGEKLVPVLESVLSFFLKHKAAAEVLAGVIAGALTIAIGAYVAKLAMAAGESVANFAKMVGGWVGIGTASEEGATTAEAASKETATALQAAATSMQTAADKISTSLAGIGTAADTAAGEVTTATGTMASDTEGAVATTGTASGELATGFAAVGTAAETAAGEVTTATGTMESETAAAATETDAETTSMAEGWANVGRAAMGSATEVGEASTAMGAAGAEGAAGMAATGAAGEEAAAGLGAAEAGSVGVMATLGPLGLAAGGAALAISMLDPSAKKAMGGLYGYVKMAGDSAATTNQFAAALVNSGAQSQAVGDAWVQAQVQGSGLGDAAAQAGITVGELSQAIQGGVGTTNQLIGVWQQSGHITAQQAATLRLLAGEYANASSQAVTAAQKVAALTTQITKVPTKWGTKITITADGTQAINELQTIQSLAGQVVNHTTNLSTGASFTTRAYAMGGWVSGTGPALVHDKEFVLTPGQAAGSEPVPASLWAAMARGAAQAGGGGSLAGLGGGGGDSGGGSDTEELNLTVNLEVDGQRFAEVVEKYQIRTGQRRGGNRTWQNAGRG